MALLIVMHCNCPGNHFVASLYQRNPSYLNISKTIQMGALASGQAGPGVMTEYLKLGHLDFSEVFDSISD